VKYVLAGEKIQRARMRAPAVISGALNVAMVCPLEQKLAAPVKAASRFAMIRPIFFAS